MHELAMLLHSHCVFLHPYDKGQPEDVLLFDDLEFETEEVETSNDGYQPKSIKELQELLTKAVADEDYETAAKIRDEISKR
jgi:excinuclease UvrABC helicase subunit UvrB